MPGLWSVNPEMPRRCPPRFEAIRGAARKLWGSNSVTQEEILAWIQAGCPDTSGTLLNAATHQPPIAAQGEADPEEFASRRPGRRLSLWHPVDRRADRADSRPGDRLQEDGCRPLLHRGRWARSRRCDGRQGMGGRLPEILEGPHGDRGRRPRGPRRHVGRDFSPTSATERAFQLI